MFTNDKFDFITTIFIENFVVSTYILINWNKPNAKFTYTKDLARSVSYLLYHILFHCKARVKFQMQFRLWI